MLLENYIKLNGAKMTLKEKSITVSGAKTIVIKGDPGLIIKAMEEVASKDASITNLDQGDYEAMKLVWPTNEEVEDYLKTQVPVPNYKASEVMIKIESEAEVDNCLVSGSKTMLEAISKELGRGEIKNGLLHIGQTESVYQIVQSLGSGEFKQAAEQSSSTDWADECSETSQPPKSNNEPDHVTSDGTTAKWISRFQGMDVNQLSKSEPDFFKQEWIETIGFSQGARKKFLSKVPTKTVLKDWAVTIYKLMESEGLAVTEKDVETAGLWAYRKYCGQLKITRGKENYICKR